MTAWLESIAAQWSVCPHCGRDAHLTLAILVLALGVPTACFVFGLVTLWLGRAQP